MEAMAMGIVAVATRVGGVPELIRDGVHGVLVDSEDSAGLADALNSLLGDADRRRVLGDEGRCIVGKGYSMERMVDEMAGVYEAVAPTLP
jgi:glycosyltransferase involved in cell wall biosynthesis